MANIQGIIVHADGTPVIDAKITLTAKQTSCCILDNIVTTIETDNGAYAFSILPGIYSVALSMPHRYDEELGIIQVYEDSPDGTLNHYLVTAKTDLRPEALRQYEQLTQQATQAAADASLSIQSLSSIKEATENAASEVVLLAGKAEAAALAAAQSETNTASSAIHADVSEKAAALHVQDTALHASNAIQCAQEAASSAVNANQAAINASDSEQSAQLHQQHAATSAAGAEASEKAAVLHVQAAEIQASNALQCAQEAALSATNAAVSASDAASSATQLAHFAADAKAQADNALTRANEAKLAQQQATQAAATAAMAATQDMLTHTVPAAIEQIETRLSTYVLHAETAEATASESAAMAALHEEAAKQAAAEAADRVQWKLITPSATFGRWRGARIDTYTTKFNVTKGKPSSNLQNYLPLSGLTGWEIQHAVDSLQALMSYGGKMRWQFYVPVADNTLMEGKTLFEVVLAIPETIIPPWKTIPAATPDKPYLALGFKARYVNGCLTFYGLNDAALGFAPGFNCNQGCEIELYFSFSSTGTGLRLSNSVMTNPVYPPLVRTNLTSPESTLCIRSGMTPVRYINFTYFESGLALEDVEHTLTEADNGKTFYYPWGLADYMRLNIPGIAFPEGFSVNLLADEGVYFICNPTSYIVSFKTTRGQVYSSIRDTGFKRLTQVGKDGRTWLLA